MASPMVRKAWTVALAGTGINLALGILYTYSVFKARIAGSEAYGWDTGSLNVPYSVCCLVFAFAMILAGRVQDRFGPRLTAFVGGLLVAAGVEEVPEDQPRAIQHDDRHDPEERVVDRQKQRLEEGHGRPPVGVGNHRW